METHSLSRLQCPTKMRRQANFGPPFPGGSVPLPKGVFLAPRNSPWTRTGKNEASGKRDISRARPRPMQSTFCDKHSRGTAARTFPPCIKSPAFYVLYHFQFYFRPARLHIFYSHQKNFRRKNAAPPGNFRRKPAFLQTALRTTARLEDNPQSV